MSSGCMRWCATISVAMALVLVSMDLTIASPPSVAEELREEKAYAQDLRGELTLLKREVATLPSDSEDADALRAEILSLQEALSQSEARISELSKKDSRTVRITGKKDDTATGKDTPSGNEGTAKVKDPCKDAKGIKLPPTRYPYEVGVNPVIPVQARDPLAKLKKIEAELKAHMVLCLPQWDAVVARAWSDRLAFLVEQLLRAEKDFAFEMGGGYTEDEFARLEAAYASSNDLSALKTQEQRRLVIYNEIWQKVQDYIDQYRLGPDSSLRLGLLAWQEKAHEARRAYEAVARKRSALEIDRVRVLRHIRDERTERGIRYLNERFPKTTFKLLKRNQLLGDSEGVKAMRRTLLGEKGAKVLKREESRRHTSGGYRIIDSD